MTTGLAEAADQRVTFPLGKTQERYWDAWVRAWHDAMPKKIVREDRVRKSSRHQKQTGIKSSRAAGKSSPCLATRA